MRAVSALVPIAVLMTGLVGCGETDQPTGTTSLLAADVVVRDWLEAVDQEDVAALADLVTPESLAFVIGVESRLDTAEITTLVDEGLPVSLVGGYWSSFGEAFLTIGGVAVGDLDVGARREFDAFGARYSAVLVGNGQGTTEILVRRTIDGLWQVDMLATIGSGLTVQLLGLAEDADSDRFRTAFEQWVMPAMEAAGSGGVDGEAAAAVRDLRRALDRRSG